MKKLLNILGAIGLAAMTSTTVVSCKNENPEKLYSINIPKNLSFPINHSVTITIENWIEIKGATEWLVNSQSNPDGKLADNLEVNPKDGSILITAEKVGQVDLWVTANINGKKITSNHIEIHVKDPILKTDLKKYQDDLILSNFKDDQPASWLKNLIKPRIAQWSKKWFEHQDYEIQCPPQWEDDLYRLKAGEQFSITSVPTSEYLTGSVTFTIKEAS